MKTNWCHYFIRILLDVYMFRAHRPIFRRVRTAVHTTIGSVSVPLCSRALYVVACLGDNIQSTRTEQHRYWTNGCVNSRTNSPEDGPVGPKHLEIQQYTNKIVTSVGFQSICWKDARYKKLKTYTRSFDKIWSRVPTLYFWGKFHINPYGSSTRYKKAGLSNEYRKVLVTINKHVYSKACVQRNKRQTLIVSLFSLLFLNQN